MHGHHVWVVPMGAGMYTRDYVLAYTCGGVAYTCGTLFLICGDAPVYTGVSPGYSPIYAEVSPLLAEKRAKKGNKKDGRKE